MKSLIAMAIVLASLTCALASDPIEATTTDGKKVILNSDRTWSYAPTGLDGSGGQTSSKPPNATKVLPSKKGFYEIWYDPQKWRPHAPGNKAAEFELEHTSGDAGAMAIAERIEMSIDVLKTVALRNAKQAAPDAVIVSETDQTVNGLKLKALRIDGTVETIPFSYYGYYWSGKGGTIQCIAYTGRNLFSEFSNDITELLNGLVITKP
jgi:hypothetical protein